MSEPRSLEERLETDSWRLTPRQREILTQMAAHPDDDEGELVYERGRGFLGNDPVAARTVFALLRLCAIKLDGGEVGGFERYRINETGQALLRRRHDA